MSTKKTRRSKPRTKSRAKPKANRVKHRKAAKKVKAAVRVKAVKAVKVHSNGELAPGDPRVLFFPEATRHLNAMKIPVNRRTLYRWAAEGYPLGDGKHLRIPTQRVGKMLYTTAAAIDEFIAAIKGIK